MRHILLSSILISLPLVAAGGEEQQDTTEYGQDQQQQTQQQDQPPVDMQGQPISTEESGQQSGQGMQDQPMQDQPISTEQTGQQQMGQQQGQAGGGEPEVARAQFTSEVQEKEPVDQVSDEFEVQEEPLYFFTEVKNGAGQTITHRWLRDGEVVAEVPLEVGSDSWRTWSSKELTPEMEGEWTVEVVDAQGNTITEQSINIQAPQQAQNVGFEQGQQQQTQDQGAQSQRIQGQDQSGQGTQDQGTQTQDQQTQDQEDWETTDPVTEDIDYEDPLEQDETQQDDMQQEDEQDTLGEDY